MDRTSLTPATARWTRGRWKGLTLVIALLAVLPISGCGAGQQTQTSRTVAAIPGANADAGPIALRDLLVPYRASGYPTGSDVPLVVRMVNSAWTPVTVTRVAPGAAGAMLIPARQVQLRIAGASGRQASEPLVVPPQAELALVPGSGPYLVAEHVAAPMGYDAELPVRFTFSTGDSVEVDMPMAPPTYPWNAPAPAPSTTSASPAAAS